LHFFLKYLQYPVYFESDEEDNWKGKGADFVAELSSIADFYGLKRLSRICEEFSQAGKVIAECQPSQQPNFLLLQLIQILHSLHSIAA
jgi:hypothetical protein